MVLSKESIESKAIVESKEPCLVISTSGMMNVGRIRHHFKRIVSDPNATILFCGYSTDGSLASMLKDNKCTVYDERPTICSVDKMYDYYKEFPKQVYYTETYKMCELLKAKYDSIGN